MYIYYKKVFNKLYFVNNTLVSFVPCMRIGCHTFPVEIGIIQFPSFCFCVWMKMGIEAEKGVTTFLLGFSKMHAECSIKMR